MTRAVIDTMFFAYALFNEPEHRQEALAVLAKTEYIHVPDLFRAEFCNFAWQWITHQQLTRIFHKLPRISRRTLSL